MNRSILKVKGAIVFGTTVLAISCGSGSEEAPDISASEVKKEAREAVSAAAGYAAKQQQEFFARARSAASDADGELARARQELADLPADARAQLEDAMDRVVQARDTLRTEIEKFQRSGADRWETTQERISAALDEMSEARREIAAALTANAEKTDDAS